jgi:hypothetical protein
VTDPVTVGPATKPATTPLAPVRKTVTVAATKEHAFSVFTDGFATWWPLSTHHVSEEVPETSVLEPFAGGRCYERCADGTECDWATVSVYDPPDRLVIVWQLNTAFKFDTTITSEVEVRFVAEGPATTRVELEHRGLDTYGDQAQAMRDAFDSDGGWGGILGAFLEAASA